MAEVHVRMTSKRTGLLVTDFRFSYDSDASGVTKFLEAVKFRSMFQEGDDFDHLTFVFLKTGFGCKKTNARLPLYDHIAELNYKN